jgi:hypothetical protein
MPMFSGGGHRCEALVRCEPHWRIGYTKTKNALGAYAMSRFAMLGFGLVAVSLMLPAMGCDSQAPTATTNSTPGGQTGVGSSATVAAGESEPTGLPTEGSPQGEADPAAVQEAFAQAMTSEVEVALAALSPEDREQAIKQKICPFSEEPLGSMGTPIKVSVAGHEVFICCEGCEAPLKQDPATHLAKIGLKPAADAAAE